MSRVDPFQEEAEIVRSLRVIRLRLSLFNALIDMMSDHKAQMIDELKAIVFACDLYLLDDRTLTDCSAYLESRGIIEEDRETAITGLRAWCSSAIESISAADFRSMRIPFPTQNGCE